MPAFRCQYRSGVASSELLSSNWIFPKIIAEPVKTRINQIFQIFTRSTHARNGPKTLRRADAQTNPNPGKFLSAGQRQVGNFLRPTAEPFEEDVTRPEQLRMIGLHRAMFACK